jgi:hypothetical protein
MNMDINFLSCQAVFFLEREMFRTNDVEKIKTHFEFNDIFFENRAIYVIMWKNTVEPDRPQVAIWQMHIACWIPKVTNTHSEYVLLIDFHCSNGCANALQCYVIRRTLPAFLFDTCINMELK